MNVHKLKTEFIFAGFTFPRYVARMPRKFKTLAERAACPVGEYYHAPTPNDSGKGFYLSESEGCSFRLRWQWANEVSGVGRNIADNLGYFCNDFGDTIRAIVFTLPNQRGFLAGWSMGDGMASTVETDCVHSSAVDAAYAADSMAERAAERERDYQADEQTARDIEDAEREAIESAYWLNRDVETV